MSIALKIVLSIVSIILIISILLQSSNSAGLSGAIGGGAEQLFGKKKARGYDARYASRSRTEARLPHRRHGKISLPSTRRRVHRERFYEI